MEKQTLGVDGKTAKAEESAGASTGGKRANPHEWGGNHICHFHEKRGDIEEKDRRIRAWSLKGEGTKELLDGQ